MNILLVNISLDVKLGGGTAERTRHLALHLVRAGCVCHVLAMTGNSWASEFESGGVTWDITGRIGHRFPLPLVRPVRMWRAIRRADVIHIMGYWNLLSIAVGFAARLAGTPYVLCPAGEFASIGRPRPIMRMFHSLVGRRLIRGASAHIAITPLESDLIADIAGCSAADVWVVPNAVSVPVESPSDAVAVPDVSVHCRLQEQQEQSGIQALPVEPYILFMGRLAPIKGPDLLLEAYLAEPSAHDFPLVIAGPDFGMKDELQRQVDASPYARQIHFIGFVGERERSMVYRRALMLVIPSRSEAMSLVALEAGSVGVPVLLTRTCGFDEVEEAGGGLVVSPDVPGLRSGLAGMLRQKEALPAMGAALRARVAQRYSWLAVTESLMERLSGIAYPSGSKRRR